MVPTTHCFINCENWEYSGRRLIYAGKYGIREFVIPKTEDIKSFCSECLWPIALIIDLVKKSIGICPRNFDITITSEKEVYNCINPRCSKHIP